MHRGRHPSPSGFGVWTTLWAHILDISHAPSASSAPLGGIQHPRGQRLTSNVLEDLCHAEPAGLVLGHGDHEVDGEHDGMHASDPH